MFKLVFALLFLILVFFLTTSYLLLFNLFKLNKTFKGNHCLFLMSTLFSIRYLFTLTNYFYFYHIYFIHKDFNLKPNLRYSNQFYLDNQTNNMLAYNHCFFFYCKHMIIFNCIVSVFVQKKLKLFLYFIFFSSLSWKNMPVIWSPGQVMYNCLDRDIWLGPHRFVTPLKLKGIQKPKVRGLSIKSKLLRTYIKLNCNFVLEKLNYNFIFYNF